MKPILFFSVLLTSAAAFALAQAPAPSPSPDAAKTEAGELGKSIMEQELAPPPGGYTYNPQGRRDPFVSLNKPVAAREKGARPQGFPGFLIQEVALRGIVKTSEAGAGSASKAGYIAIFAGNNGQSYFVSVGQRLFDGVSTAIDASSVTFRQEVTDPLSPVKTRDVRKSLYASEEARQ